MWPEIVFKIINDKQKQQTNTYTNHWTALKNMINFARHLIAEVLSIVEAQLSGILRFLDGIASPIALCIDFAFWLQCSISLGYQTLIMATPKSTGL